LVVVVAVRLLLLIMARVGKAVFLPLILEMEELGVGSTKTVMRE
jgi:hypothetical protein